MKWLQCYCIKYLIYKRKLITKIYSFLNLKKSWNIFFLSYKVTMGKNYNYRNQRDQYSDTRPLRQNLDTPMKHLQQILAATKKILKSSKEQLNEIHNWLFIISKAARKHELTKLLRFLNVLVLHDFTFLKGLLFIFVLTVLIIHTCYFCFNVSHDYK